MIDLCSRIGCAERGYTSWDSRCRGAYHAPSAQAATTTARRMFDRKEASSRQPAPLGKMVFNAGRPLRLLESLVARLLRLESRNINARRTTRSCRRTERIVFVTTKDYRGQDGGRVVVLPIARGHDIRLALARAGRHDFLAAAATATLATAALTANVAPRVTIVLP
eukprot:scaffold95757_cov67-Phaeocystis_antarctica.AAC.3